MIKTVTLESGVRLVMEYLPYVQSVVTGIWVKAGAANEDETYSGISHYVEHMMFKGTEKRSAKQIAEEIDRIGGQMNAFTGKEATCYYARSINENFEETADVLVDMITGSILAKEEMDKERKVIFEEIKMTEDTPSDLVHETIVESVFKHHDLGKSILGREENLNRIDSSVMREYMRRFYTRSGIVISVAGNFDEEKVKEYFSSKFLNLEDTPSDYPKREGEYSPIFRNVKKDIEQSHICLAVPGVKLEDPEYYSLSVLNNVIGGSMSSRLFQNIREDKGLAYSVYSMSPSFGRGGYFNIYAGVSHDKIECALAGIKEELIKIREDGITKDELYSSKEQLKASYIYGQENVSGRMFANGKNLTISGITHEADEIIAEYDRVTMEDIEKVCSILGDFDRWSAAIVTDRNMDIEEIVKNL